MALRSRLNLRIIATAGSISQHALRGGVALLGLTLPFGGLVALGPAPLLLGIGAMLTSLIAGFWIARAAGLSCEEALLSSGAVGICGASAAAAIGSILPAGAERERQVSVIIAGVTPFGSAAMLVLPLLIHLLGFGDRIAGLFLGATIHDMAQVVAAGATISSAATRVAVLTKMIRVAMLPVVLIGMTLFLRLTSARRREAVKEGAATALPGFILLFLLFSAASSVMEIPPRLSNGAIQISSFLFLMAMAGVGVRSDFRQCFRSAGRCYMAIALQSGLIALFALVVIYTHLV